MNVILCQRKGAAIGLEREFQGKAAGIRTNMPMCIGSCLIIIIEALSHLEVVEDVAEL